MSFSLPETLVLLYEKCGLNRSLEICVAGVIRSSGCTLYRHDMISSNLRDLHWVPVDHVEHVAAVVERNAERLHRSPGIGRAGH